MGLVAHVELGRADVQSRIAAMQHAMGGGSGGTQMAMQAIEFIVRRQAMVLAFEKMFLLAGILFVVVMPLLIFLKAPKSGASGAKVDAHVEL